MYIQYPPIYTQIYIRICKNISHCARILSAIPFLLCENTKGREGVAPHNYTNDKCYRKLFDINAGIII